MAVAAVQVVQGSLITKQQVALAVALLANKHLVHLLQVLVVGAERKLPAETVAPHGVVANPELQVQLATAVMAVFILLLLAAVAVAAILAAAAAVATTAVLEPTVADQVVVDQVFTQQVAHVHKVFRLVMVRL